jgi:hypothetical protein
MSAPVRTETVTYRSVLVLAALALGPGSAYAAGVAVPYYPGRDDAGWLSLLGVYAVVLAPLGALFALAGCGVQLLAAFPRSARRLSPGVAAGLAVVALLCVGIVAFLLSPLGRALTIWQMD